MASSLGSSSPVTAERTKLSGTSRRSTTTVAEDRYSGGRAQMALNDPAKTTMNTTVASHLRRFHTSSARWKPELLRA